MARFRLRPKAWIIGGTGRATIAGSLQVSSFKSLGSVLLTGRGRTTTTTSSLSYQVSSGGQVAVGELVSDGPTTPHQIALWLPVTGIVAQTATASCDYKLSSSGSWIQGHPLYRIRPEFLYDVPEWGGPVQDGFAWTILDLQPGTLYDVRVIVTEGVNSVTKYLYGHQTRALPSVAGTPNKQVLAGNASDLRTKIAGLVAGDVLEIPDGEYAITTSIPISINGNGNPGGLIYIRGQSRTGAIVHKTTLTSEVFAMNQCSYIVFENFTIQGTGQEPMPEGHIGVQTAFNQSTTQQTQKYITIRNMIMVGVDRGVNCPGGSHATGDASTIRPDADYNIGWLIYDNTWTGNNKWESSPVDYLYTNRTFNDHGIECGGRGNCAWQNTLYGFGDAFAHSDNAGGAQCDSSAVHFYRNEIRTCTDDSVEFDNARRNVTFYDNRCHNVMNASSFNPIYGGPAIIARNVYVNILRARIHKWQSTQAGIFFYSNTTIQNKLWDSDTFGDMCLWYQPSNNNAPTRSFGYRNNLHIYRGDSTYSGYHTIRLDNVGASYDPKKIDAYDPMDWTHNSWFPNRNWRLPHNTTSNNFSSLAALQNPTTGAPNVTPVFSGQNRPMYLDNIVSSNPWSQQITFSGPDSRTEYTGTFYPIVGEANARNTGVHIPNITDGHDGLAPDRGGVITGRAVVAYGDQTGVIAPEEELPAWVPSVSDGQGKFANVPMANGQPHDAMSINFNVVGPDGFSPTPYPNLFNGPSGGFEGVWNSQTGGAYAPLLGAYGSFLLFGGGHFTNNGNGVVRFDIETGLFSHFRYPDWCATDHSVINGTVATLTGTVSTTGSNDDPGWDRVGKWGQYVKTADDVPIPNTDIDGDFTTNWIPAAIHGNDGMVVIPPEGGGESPYGSLVIAGHDQTGIVVDYAHHMLWILGLASKTWSVWKHGFGNQYSVVGLEYDSYNKLLWYVTPGTNADPYVFNFATRTTHRPSVPNIVGLLGTYQASMCYWPTRRMMVGMGSLGVHAVDDYNLTAENEWSNTVSMTAGDTLDTLRCNARFLNSVVCTVTLQRATASSTGPWTDVQQWTSTGERLYSTIADKAITGTAWYRIGIKTGDYLSASGNAQAYAYSMRPQITLLDISNYQFGVTPTLTYSRCINTQNFWTGGVWPKDDGTIMWGSGWPANPHITNENVEYCSEEDCFFMISRPNGGPSDNPPTPRSQNTSTTLHKLWPPAAGRELIDPWVWTSEVVTEVPGTGGIGFMSKDESPHSCGKAAYVPALKSIVMTDRPEVPAQVVRSATWTGGPPSTPTSLKTAAAAVASNTFVKFEQASMSNTSAPIAGGTNGAFAAEFTGDGSTSTTHPCIDWASDGCYDPFPSKRRITWASCGAGNLLAGNWVYNTQPLYNEATNTWTVNRSFRGANETASTTPIVHFYDGNAIDVVGRRFYRKKFSSDEKLIMVYDLTNDIWLNSFASPTNEAYGRGDTALCWIPTRGTAGRLWMFGTASSNSFARLWEYNGSTWATLLETTAFTGNSTAGGLCMSYNPRGYAGVGSVMVGSKAGTWMINASTLAVTVAANPTVLLGSPHDYHFCRDPVGTGYLLFARDGYVYRNNDGTAWVQRAQLPGRFATPNYTDGMVVVPIDAEGPDYGVVWLITWAGVGDRAWLYRP